MLKKIKWWDSRAVNKMYLSKTRLISVVIKKHEGQKASITAFSKDNFLIYIDNLFEPYLLPI